MRYALNEPLKEYKSARINENQIVRDSSNNTNKYSHKKNKASR